MAVIPGTTYDVFVTTGQTINIVETSDPNNVPPAIPGDFNLEIVLGGADLSVTPAPGYQGLAFLSTDGHTLYASHGDFGIIDSGGNDSISLGDGNTSVLGAAGDTLVGGFHSNQFLQFLDGHLGHQSVAGQPSVFGGPAQQVGNVTIWGGPGDTLFGGAWGNVTIGGIPTDTIFAGNGNVFIDASAGNQTINFQLSGSVTIWGGPGDLINAPFFTSHVGGIIGGAPGDTIGGGPGFFIDGSRGNQSITGGGLIWGGPGDTIHGGGLGSETIAGFNDTVFGDTGDNEFIDGSRGNEFITGGSFGNETIWGALTDTITGGTGGNQTIAGASGETIIGGAANTFLDATSGNESVGAGAGKTTMWGGAHDTVRGFSGGSALIGFAGGNETFWDDGATSGRHDSISTFNAMSSGDRVSLNSATDTVANVVSTQSTDASGNTTVTFHDGSMLTFIGISNVNGGFFTTH